MTTQTTPVDPTTPTDASAGAARTDTPPAIGEQPVPVDLDDSDRRGSGGGTKAQAKDELHRRVGEVRDFTRQAQDRARDEARRRQDQAREGYEHAKREAAHRYKEYRRMAGERASSLIDQQKHRLTGGIGDLAAATRAAAEELRGRNDETVARYADAAADSLERLRDYADHASGRDVAREAAGFTRNRPEWVLGAAFLAGLGISRFLKADRRRERGHGLPEGADDHLYEDVVAQQHEEHRATGTRSPVPPFPEDASPSEPSDVGSLRAGPIAPVESTEPVNPATPVPTSRPAEAVAPVATGDDVVNTPGEPGRNA